MKKGKLGARIIWLMYIASQVVLLILKQKSIVNEKFVWIPSYIMLGLLILAVFVNVPESWKVMKEMEAKKDKKRTGLHLKEIEGESVQFTDVFGGDLNVEE